MLTRVVGFSPRAGGLPRAPQRGALSWFEIVLCLACLALVALRLPPSLQDIFVLSFLWAGLALAWNIAGGYAGLISFGHMAFFGIGAYTSTLLNVKAGVNPWIGIWVGAALAAIVGALLSMLCARLRGPFFILSTLAVAEIVRIGALNWVSLTGGPMGVSIMPVASIANMVFDSKQAYMVLMLGYLVLLYGLSKVIEGSRYGYYLFAVRDNEDAASAAGINPLAVRTAAMGASAFLTAIGGSLFAQYFLYLDPTSVVSLEGSFQIALLAALGGLGTTIGPVLGAFAIIPLSELLRAYLGSSANGLHLIIYGGVVIVVMLYFPGGLAAAVGRVLGSRGEGRS